MKSMFSPEQYEWFVSKPNIKYLQTITKYNSLLVSIYKIMQYSCSNGQYCKRRIVKVLFSSIYFPVVIYY